MAWQNTLAADTEESIMESVVSRVRSSMSVEVNFRVVLVMSGGEGGATVRVALTVVGRDRGGRQNGTWWGRFEIGFL